MIPGYERESCLSWTGAGRRKGKVDVSKRVIGKKTHEKKKIWPLDYTRPDGSRNPRL